MLYKLNTAFSDVNDLVYKIYSSGTVSDSVKWSVNQFHKFLDNDLLKKALSMSPLESHVIKDLKNRAISSTVVKEMLSSPYAAPIVLAFSFGIILVIRDRCKKRDLSLLFKAFREKNEKEVERLVRKGVDVPAVDHSDDGQMTPLHYATTLGWTKIIKLLLEKNADPKAKNSLKDTPLHIACEEKKIESVCALIDTSDLEARSFHGATPLFCACKLYGNREPAIVRLLLERNVNVNACDATRLTSLHLACSSLSRDQEGSRTIVRLLLAVKGVNVNPLDSDNKTPLDLANDPEIIQMLVSRGAKKGKDLQKE